MTETAYLADLNTMMESWSLERLMVYQLLQESKALTASTGSYTIGTGGAFYPLVALARLGLFRPWMTQVYLGLGAVVLAGLALFFFISVFVKFTLLS